ncbi:MAG: extracellular solute-binding protein, partial [Planctomycetes bacterium]|nr:extracellular solute-binding protein [Planctomycetota bacterium]
AELAQAGDLIQSWKSNLAKFDVDEAKIGLGAGEFLVVHAYNGDVALIMEENPDIGFYIPEEGSSFAADDFVITAASPEADLAHAFINHFLDPDNAAANMESIRYFMPNPAAVAMLDDDLRENPAFNVPDEVMGNCEVIRDLGEDNNKYIAVWDRIKAE